MKNLFLLLHLIFWNALLLISCNDTVAIQQDLFDIEYTKGQDLLKSAEGDLKSWKEAQEKLVKLQAFEDSDKTLLKLNQDLDRFTQKMDAYKRELEGWNNMTKDFETMKKKNVKNMSEMRLKDAKDINKNIVRMQNAGNRILKKIENMYLK